jgi:hypothetical protein
MEINMFSLDKEQRKKVTVWKNELDKKTIERQRASMSPEDFEGLTGNGKYPYGGAIGGSLTYSFTDTSLGTVIKVKDGFSGEEIDVSDYHNW